MAPADDVRCIALNAGSKTVDEIEIRVTFNNERPAIGKSVGRRVGRLED